MSFVNLDFARVDTDRQRRCGFPEVIFGAGKTPEEVAAIAGVLIERHGLLLATRVKSEHYAAVKAQFPDAEWHARAGCITLERNLA